MSAALGKLVGAGEAGLDTFVAVAELEVALLVDGLGSIGAEDVGAGEAGLTSSIPPPDVTSGFSGAAFLQNDHLGFASSACWLVSACGASGSPKRDRLVQLSRLSRGLSLRRDRRPRGIFRREVSGVVFGLLRA